MSQPKNITKVQSSGSQPIARNSKTVPIKNGGNNKPIAKNIQQSTGKSLPNEKKSPTTGQQPNAGQNHQKRGKNKRKRTSVGQNKEDQLQIMVNKELSTCKKGDEIKVLCAVLQPNPNNLEQAFRLVKQDLMDVLHERFNKYQFDVTAFGSTVNGLAFRDSDFDLYVQIEPRDKPVDKIIYIIIASMQRHKTFRKMLPIVNAKIPIIKCVHLETGYSCDISFSNAIGVYNTKVMRHLITFDYRIHPLAVILKYWMRTHDLSGTGRITNYCLMLLIIYYLQTIKPPILPAYDDFQKDVDCFNIEYWNLACDLSIQTWHRNQMKVSDLLLGFFKFYSNFNFTDSIVSTLHAVAYNRNEFKAAVPQELWRYTEYLRRAGTAALKLNVTSKICVQDPFNLSLNVGACVSAVHLELFQRELRFAADRCSVSLKNQEIRPADLLLGLFNEFAPAPTVVGKNIAATVSPSRFECKLQPIEFELAIIRTMLMNRSTEVVEPHHVLRVWSDKMVEFIETVFQRLFMCEIEPINISETSRVAKYPKVDGDKDVYSTVLVKQFSIRAAYDVYSDRKALKPNSATYLSEHEQISRYNLAAKRGPIDLKATVSLSVGDAMDFIVVHLADCSAVKEKRKQVPVRRMFNNFVQSIRNHLRAYFLRYRDEVLASTKEKQA